MKKAFIITLGAIAFGTTGFLLSNYLTRDEHFEPIEKREEGKMKKKERKIFKFEGIFVQRK